MKDQIIQQVARLLRQWQFRGRVANDPALHGMIETLNSYGDTSSPEEALKILTTLPRGE